MAEFFIVIPTFNSSHFLERCLISVITMQPSDHRVRIHIQDGGSTDATEEIAKRWSDRGVTFHSEADEGLYDALQKASAHLRENDIMTWVGVDDYLMPGAVPTAAHIFENLPDVNWITGRPLMGIDGGENFCMYPGMVYTQNALIAGKHDGRSAHFVQQEGTFWRASLWNKAGGLDTSFKLAGDWDLWRRFAQHTPLYSVESPFAKFTRREGQKSQSIEDYWAEVDAAAPLPPGGDDIDYRLMRYHVGSEWIIEKTEHAPPIYAPAASDAAPSWGSETASDASPEAAPNDIASDCFALAGFAQPEGPYSEQNLPRFRWALGPSARITVKEGAHPKVMRIRMASFLKNQRVTVFADGRKIATLKIPEFAKQQHAFVEYVFNFVTSAAVVINLEFSKWDREGDRPIAILVSAIESH